METKKIESPVVVKFLAKFFDRFGFDNYDVLFKVRDGFGYLRLVSCRLLIGSDVLAFLVDFCDVNRSDIVSYDVAMDESLGLYICLQVEL